MNIFVIGFQRSGTTLLRRILNNHPDMSVLHEQKFIKSGKTKEIFLRNVYAKLPRLKERKNWGDKLPWYDKTGNMIIRLSKKWAMFFEDDARIIHIIRHPIDVALSNKKRKWASNLERPISYYYKSVPRVIELMNSDDRFTNITFEDLVTNKNEMITKLFEFCGVKVNKEILKEVINADYRYFKGINKDRAFAYRKEKAKVKLPKTYKELLKDAKLL